MNRRSQLSSSFISASGTKTTGHSLKTFNTHDHFGKLIYISGKSHLMEYAEYLSLGWIYSPSGNTNSIYLEAIISAFNCSADPLVN